MSRGPKRISGKKPKQTHTGRQNKKTEWTTKQLKLEQELESSDSRAVWSVDVRTHHVCVVRHRQEHMLVYRCRVMRCHWACLCIGKTSRRTRVTWLTRIKSSVLDEFCTIAFVVANASTMKTYHAVSIGGLGVNVDDDRPFFRYYGGFHECTRNIPL